MSTSTLCPSPATVFLFATVSGPLPLVSLARRRCAISFTRPRKTSLPPWTPLRRRLLQTQHLRGTILKSSRLVLHLRSSYTISRQYWDSMVVVVRFIFVPLSHSLRRTSPRVCRHDVKNVKGLLTGCPYVADKKDLSAPLATEPRAPSR